MSLMKIGTGHTLWDNLEKCGRARQATGDIVIQHRQYVTCILGN